MSDLIQCPQCSKRYKLPASPPPTFTCRQCGTVMDLSAFRAAAAPAVPAPAAPSRGGSEAPSRGRHGRGGHAAHPRSGRRGRERAEPESEEEGQEERGHGRYHRKKSSPALLWGSLAAFLVAAVLVIVLMSGKDGDEGNEGATVAQNPPAGDTPAAPPGGGAAGTPRGGAAETPAAPPGTGGPAQPPRSGRVDKAEILAYPYADDVTAEERQKIDEAVVTAVETGGRDGREAEKYLVSMQYKAITRLVSEFKNIQGKHGLEAADGLSRAMVVDRILRRIDGVQERKFKDTQTIHASSDPSSALTTVRRWNWWIQNEEWKKNPQKPWDPAVDEADDEGAGGEK